MTVGSAIYSSTSLEVNGLNATFDYMLFECSTSTMICLNSHNFILVSAWIASSLLGVPGITIFFALCLGLAGGPLWIAQGVRPTVISFSSDFLF